MGRRGRNQLRPDHVLRRISEDNHFCGRGFLWLLREWMRVLHDQFRQRPPSLLILFRCSSISMPSLIIWSMYLDLGDRMLVTTANPRTRTYNQGGHEIKLHPNNMNRKDGLCLTWS